MTQICQVAITQAQTHLQQLQSNVARGIYASAEVATRHYQQSKDSIAKCLCTQPERLHFGSNTTDLINQLARSICATLSKGSTIVTTAAEHHSNFLPWQQLAQQHQLHLEVLPLLRDGAVDWSHLQQLDTKAIALVATHHASNVTGIVNDLTWLSQWCKRHRIHSIIDGTQMPQHQLPDFTTLDVDAYIFSAHKTYALAGLGILHLKQQLQQQLQAVVWGGGMVAQVDISADKTHFQPHQLFAAGTPNLLAIRCLAATLNWLTQQSMDVSRESEQTLYQLAIKQLKQTSGVRILNSTNKMQIPIISFYHERLHAHDIANVLAQHGVAVRAGHHCAQLLMQHWQLDACVRISLAPYNDNHDLQRLQQALHCITEFDKQLHR